MNIRLAMVSLLAAIAATLASFWLDHTDRLRTAEGIRGWALSHAQWRDDPNAPEPWRWRAPSSANRLARWSTIQPRTFLLAGAGQEVWAVNEAAGVGKQAVPTEVIPLLSISTAGFLGVALPMETHHFDMLAEGIVAGLDPWRTVMVQRCGDCAPHARAFPAPDVPVLIAENSLDAHGATGINIDVERRRRSVVPFNNSGRPLTEMVIRIRNGAMPTAAQWSTPGLAGMAALELAAQGRSDLRSTFQQLGRTGPSRTDRIAGLWAAHLMGVNDDPYLAAIEALL